ncbi:hypothetical protein QTP70_000787 [Hemibagrus guttatus]|uniref:Ig-like domain-containing protein n=1 Tax=Hemibagrus guttatus TaxID=175788 RepID=A0AAE0R6G8_9TELE|nr:hypothetical protein QTP70_000787 [Hemibagrus guttatus]
MFFRYANTSLSNDFMTTDVKATAKPKPTVRVNPQSSVYTGDTVTLSCELQQETGWEFHWFLRRERPQAVLSVSPQSWLTEGDSVTLSCEVTDSSTDWTFSWYTVVPYRDGLTGINNNRDYSVYVELLSDSSKGSGGNYTLSPAALKHTGVYMCRGERGEPALHTQYSNPQPLWITGESSPVSLIINPSRTQHFTNDSLSLSCKDQSNSTGWTVRRYTHSERVLDCSHWGSVTGSTCNISFLSTSYTGVYWCESESGENSNPVNITVHGVEAPFSVLMLICSVVTASLYLLVTFILLLICYRAREILTLPSSYIKFLEDMTTVGLRAYREKVQQLMQWCRANNLSLNINKTEEMDVDFRRAQSTDRLIPTDPLWRSSRATNSWWRTSPGHSTPARGYAPQVGCELEEKERFWSELDEVMESIPTGERVVIGADFNGHVGEGNRGDEEVMGKFGVQERNLEGQMVVDFAKRTDMGVVNTYFQKREEHRVTYKSGGRRTQVDYILCRRGNLKEISDCKVVVGESVARQHRMVVCRMTLMVCKTKRSKIEKKTKWWKLKKEECCEEFRQKLRQALGGQVVLPDDWETTAEVIRETGRKVLGVSSGRRKEDKETWWWNEEVQDSIQRKRLAKKKWDMDRTEENRWEYKELQRRVKREVSKAKQKAYDELYTRLDTREGEKDLYRLARQRDQDGKDVQQKVDKIRKDEVRKALTRMKSWKGSWS